MTMFPPAVVFQHLAPADRDFLINSKGKGGHHSPMHETLYTHESQAHSKSLTVTEIVHEFLLSEIGNLTTHFVFIQNYSYRMACSFLPMVWQGRGRTMDGYSSEDPTNDFSFRTFTEGLGFCLFLFAYFSLCLFVFNVE